MRASVNSTISFGTPSTNATSKRLRRGAWLDRGTGTHPTPVTCGPDKPRNPSLSSHTGGPGGGVVAERHRGAGPVGRGFGEAYGRAQVAQLSGRCVALDRPAVE